MRFPKAQMGPLCGGLALGYVNWRADARAAECCLAVLWPAKCGCAVSLKLITAVLTTCPLPRRAISEAGPMIPELQSLPPPAAACPRMPPRLHADAHWLHGRCKWSREKGRQSQGWGEKAGAGRIEHTFLPSWARVKKRAALGGGRLLRSSQVMQGEAAAGCACSTPHSADALSTASAAEPLRLAWQKASHLVGCRTGSSPSASGAGGGASTPSCASTPGSANAARSWPMRRLALSLASGVLSGRGDGGWEKVGVSWAAGSVQVGPGA